MGYDILIKYEVSLNREVIFLYRADRAALPNELIVRERVPFPFVVVKPLARAIRARLSSVRVFEWVSRQDGFLEIFQSCADFGHASSTVQCSKFHPAFSG